jgi:hypothetical protein
VNDETAGKAGWPSRILASMCDAQEEPEMCHSRRSEDFLRVTYKPEVDEQEVDAARAIDRFDRSNIKVRWAYGLAVATTDHRWPRRTALEYLETVLPARIFSLLGPRLAVNGTPAPKHGDPASVRAQLLDAAAMRTRTRHDVGRRPAADLDEE